MASALQSIVTEHGQYWHASFMIPVHKPSEEIKISGFFLPFVNTKALSTFKYHQDTIMK